MKHSKPGAPRSIGTALKELPLRGLVALQVFATREPVRTRSLLTSLIVAGGVLVPALANQNTAQMLAGIGVTALPVLIGEGARSKVTPV